ncbi:MAG: FimB/Mfa2 family fimbrial subunit [Muribaculaceae bacterium]|nr:FimB/Mfa2 family fimbrial subunit [Muribaculaceae bacterium]
MLHNFSNKVRLFAFACLAGMAFSGCSLLEEDLEPCPAQLQLQFVYNYNLLKADAFPTQVKSVNVWAFDPSGACVWSGAESGDKLAEPGYVMVTPLEEGTYDFVVWAGLDNNTDFNLATYTPASKQELEVTLNTISSDGLNISSSQFSGLFHGYVGNVSYSVNPQAPSIKTVTVPLVKDTNNIAVMLCNINGFPLDTKDFTVEISYADSWLAWNNNVMANSPLVTYKPWSYSYGQTTLQPAYAPGETAARSSILYELSMSRLILNGDAYINVYRNTDGHRIIHLPLIEYFLIEKGSRYDEFGDQEYLDRRDDYSLLFFIADDMNWYMAAGIYINGWVVVPTQDGQV